MVGGVATTKPAEPTGAPAKAPVKEGPTPVHTGRGNEKARGAPPASPGGSVGRHAPDTRSRLLRAARADRHPRPPTSPDDRRRWDELLLELGVALDGADRDRLALSYGPGVDLSRTLLRRPGQAALLPRLVHHARAHTCPAGCAHLHEAPIIEPLSPALRAGVEQATGVRLDDVRVGWGAPLRAGRLGEALGDVIRIALPRGSAEAETVLRHEAIHLAQARAPGAAAVPVPALELEARFTASRVAEGEAAPLRGRPAGHTPAGLDATDLAAAVGVDPLSWLLDQLPGLDEAQDGFAGFLDELGEAAGAGLDQLLAVGSVESLIGTALDAVGLETPPDQVFGLLTGCCTCLQEALQSVLQAFSGWVNRPEAAAGRERVAEDQESMIDSMLDLLASGFDGLKQLARPLVWLVDTVTDGWNALKAALGAVADEAWRAVAPALGLDPNLPPAEAIEKRLAELWDAALVALQPFTDALADAWARIKENPLVAAVLRFARDTATLWESIQRCIDSASRDPQVWLAILARDTQGTVFEDLVAGAESGYDGLLDLRDGAVNWLLGVLADLGITEAWNSSLPVLRQIGAALQSFVARIRRGIESLQEGVVALFDKAVAMLVSFWDGLRPYVSFVIGFSLALTVLLTSGNPLPMAGFLFGRIFLALPDCYRLAVLDFVLDLVLVVLRTLPEVFPTDIFLKSAAISLVEAIRGAPEATRLMAVDTAAALISLDVEVIAGVAVGFVEGLWESTLGLLVRLAIWPFRQMIEGAWTAFTSLLELSERSFDRTLSGLDWLGEALEGLVEIPEAGSYHPSREVEPPPADEPDPDPGVFDPLPAMPEAPDPMGLFDHLFRRGVTRQELGELFESLQATAAEYGAKVGKDAAELWLGAMGTRASAFHMGELAGMVVGWVVGEIIILIFTAGVATAIAKGAEAGVLLGRLALNFPRLAEAVVALGRYLEPIFTFFARLWDELAVFGRRLVKWLDDLVIWLRNQLLRIIRWIEADPHPPRRAMKVWKWLKRAWNLVMGGEEERDLEGAAAQGWAAVLDQMPGELRDREGVQRILGALDLAEEITLEVERDDETWQVRASDGDDEARAGAGWVDEDLEARPFFATEDASEENHALLEAAEAALRAYEQSGDAPQAAYEGIRSWANNALREQIQLDVPLVGATFTVEMEEWEKVESDDLIGTWLKIVPNASTAWLNIPVGLTEYLGARLTEDGSTFAGTFEVPPWDWATDYATFPSGPVTRHPFNAEYGLRDAGDLADMKPNPIKYTYRMNDETPGARALRRLKSQWQSKIEAERQDLEDAMEPEEGVDPLAASKAALLGQYAELGYSDDFTYDDLLLQGKNDWEGHHVQPHAWGGDDADTPNFQYIPKGGQHAQLSRFWNNRAREVKKALGLPWRKKSTP